MIFGWLQMGDAYYDNYSKQLFGKLAIKPPKLCAIYGSLQMRSRASCKVKAVANVPWGMMIEFMAYGTYTCHHFCKVISQVLHINVEARKGLLWAELGQIGHVNICFVVLTYF